jgi:predicted hydrocarbon binding protein
VNRPLELVVDRARRDVGEYLKLLDRDPHVLVPARVISRDLLRIATEAVGPAGAAQLVKRLGREIGRASAEAFLGHRESDGVDPVYRLLTGSMHLASAGFGDVDLLVFEPTFDERFAVLWESENSSSARNSVQEAGRSRVCHLEAGYSAGWCSVATGLPVEARELACRSEGVARCRFLVAHAGRFEAALADPRFHQPSAEYSVTPVRISAPGPP